MSALVSSDMNGCDGDDGLIPGVESFLGSDVDDLGIVVPANAS